MALSKRMFARLQKQNLPARLPTNEKARDTPGQFVRLASGFVETDDLRIPGQFVLGHGNYLRWRPARGITQVPVERGVDAFLREVAVLGAIQQDDVLPQVRVPVDGRPPKCVGISAMPIDFGR